MQRMGRWLRPRRIKAVARMEGVPMDQDVPSADAGAQHLVDAEAQHLAGVKEQIAFCDELIAWAKRVRNIGLETSDKLISNEIYENTWKGMCQDVGYHNIDHVDRLQHTLPVRWNRAMQILIEECKWLKRSSSAEQK